MDVWFFPIWWVRLILEHICGDLDSKGAAGFFLLLSTDNEKGETGVSRRVTRLLTRAQNNPPGRTK